MITAFAGSGGKTTSVFRMAQKLREDRSHPHRKILITTTTQMYLPAEFRRLGGALPFYEERFCCLSGSLEEIRHRLETDGICLAGLPSPRYPDTKLSALPPDVYQKAALLADDCLIEADGSRGLPLKYPASHEPVIPKNTDRIFVLYGPEAIGKPLSQVTFRPEAALDCLNRSGEFSTVCTPDTIISPHIIRILYTRGYLEPLSEEFPGIPILLQAGPVL